MSFAISLKKSIEDAVKQHLEQIERFGRWDISKVEYVTLDPLSGLPEEIEIVRGEVFEVNATGIARVYQVRPSGGYQLMTYRFHVLELDVQFDVDDGEFNIGEIEKFIPHD